MFEGSGNSVTPAESAPWRMAGVKVRGGWEDKASISLGQCSTLDFTPSALGNPGRIYTQKLHRMNRVLRGAL